MKNHCLELCVFFCIGFSIESAESAQAIVYDRLFPRYLQPCALTPIQKTQGARGTVAGHAVLYVKGMCRDRTAPFPKVQVCGPETDLTHPDSGTLISVDRRFKNTNWVAVEGKRLAFHGGLHPGESVNREAKEQAIQAVVQSGAFDGIEMHDSFLKTKPAGMSDAESLAHMGIGTDFAIDFASTSQCNLIPISEAQLQDVVDYLNDLNSPYNHHWREYQWNPFTNNCAQVVRNVLAAIGIRSFQPTQTPTATQFFETPLPANNILITTEKSVKESNRDIFQLYRNKRFRKAFERYEHPPLLPGFMMTTLPMNQTNNTLYQLRSRFFMLDLPFLAPRKRQLMRFLSDPQLTDLQTALETSLEHLNKKIAEVPPLEQLEESHPNLVTPQFRKFYRNYLRWLDQSMRDVRQKLNLLP